MSNKSFSEEQMRNLLKSVATDLTDAKLYLNYSNAMCLIRVYDQHKEGIGLKLFLKRVSENIELFKNKTPENSSEEFNFINQIKKDMDFVNHQKNIPVKYLKIIRDNAIFHRSEGVLRKEKPDVDGIKINHEEITKLIDDGLKILNYYSQALNNSTYDEYMLGYGDHKTIFETMQKHHDNLIASTSAPPPLSFPPAQQ